MNNVSVKFVSIYSSSCPLGYQNWLALRQEWKRRPDGWQPQKRKPINSDQVRAETFIGPWLEQSLPWGD